MAHRVNYEADPDTFGAEGYTVEGYRGIAWYVLGWETAPDRDTEWTGLEERTGQVVCQMVGDDRRFCFEPGEVHEIAREEFCGVCGQIGCRHDGYERSE